ncbi:MAG: LysM peptidoglycan-binding domain-containing protein [Chlamydiales bacterium]
MKSRLLAFCLLIGGSLSGAPSLEMQQMHLTLDQYGYQLNNHKIEIELLYERIQSLETALTELHQELMHRNQKSSLEKRFSSLEKAHETLVNDFITLKKHMNETKSALAQCQDKTSQISSDVKSLKSSLHSMLALLQKENGQTYTVKSGDSLGQIALEYKTDIKAIKERNQLTNDTIYPGQELIIP